RCAQLHDGVAGVVIHRDVGVLPSSAVIATDAVLEDAFADLPEAAQLLDVQVHQLTGRGVLIPIRRWARLALGARAAVPHKHPPDRRRRPPQRGRQRARPPPRLAPQLHDLQLRLNRQAMRTPLRDRRTIPQPLPTALSITAKQPIRGGTAHPARHRSGLGTESRKHQPNQPTPRLPRMTQSAWPPTLHHHGPPSSSWSSTTTRLVGGPDTVSRLAGS